MLGWLRGPAAIAIPVYTLTVGAIGTTLIGAYLTLRQFANDLLPPNGANVAMAGVVLVPAGLACGGPHLAPVPTSLHTRIANPRRAFGDFVGGPALYLPLLSMSGAFPCTILYVLMPLLAAVTLRSRGVGGKEQWLPGGNCMLLTLSVAPAALILVTVCGIVKAFL